MIYIGVDHGTTSMRFAAISEDMVEPLKFEISREDTALLSESEVISTLETGFGVNKDEIAMIAVTYSMGDGISAIEDIRNVLNRGVKTIDGVGKKTGAGSRIFDAVLHSNIPAVVIPGLHDSSNTDKRLNVFSHSTSPEKISIAYNAFCKGFQSFVLSDISSNTVTLAVSDGKLIGAIDACIFAPGLFHGPLDVQAIRNIDAGKMSANKAFMHAGVLKKSEYKDLQDLVHGLNEKESNSMLALDTIALFASMEIISMQLLLKDYGTTGEVFIAGSVAEIPYLIDKIHEHLKIKCHVLDRWSAAIGGAEIVRDIVNGSREILGLQVNL